jgi:hypothetical protein
LSLKITCKNVEMCAVHLESAKIWQKAYKESMTVEYLTQVTNRLKDIIKILEKTHKSYLRDWPTPNSKYCNTIGEIYIELLDNIPDRLWTPFGSITLSGGVTSDSHDKSIGNEVLQNLRNNFIITDVTDGHTAAHKPNLYDPEWKLFIIESMDNPKYSKVDNLEKELLLYSVSPPHWLNEDHGLTRTMFEQLYGKTLLQ